MKANANSLMPNETAVLPAETRMGRVHLRTRDVSRALGFYQDVLGLKVSRPAGFDGAVSASDSGAALVVFSQDVAATPRVRRTTGLYHLAIRYPTRSALAGALVRLARRQYPIQGASDHLVSEAIYLSDPDGNGVELYSDRPRAQWLWRDGQVEMATERLDLDDLLQTAGDHAETPEPPPGTEIGHIHLHVADLAHAEQFYHGVLGLAVTQRSYPGALFFSAGGYHHHLAANTWAGTASPAKDSVGLISYRFVVPGEDVLRHIAERAAVRGYEANLEASQRLLRIRDSNDNWVELASTG